MKGTKALSVLAESSFCAFCVDVSAVANLVAILKTAYHLIDQLHHGINKRFKILFFPEGAIGIIISQLLPKHLLLVKQRPLKM